MQGAQVTAQKLMITTRPRCSDRRKVSPLSSSVVKSGARLPISVPTARPSASADSASIGIAAADELALPTAGSITLNHPTAKTNAAMAMPQAILPFFFRFLITDGGSAFRPISGPCRVIFPHLNAMAPWAQALMHFPQEMQS